MGFIVLITDQVRLTTRKLKNKNHFVVRDSSQFENATFKPPMSVKEIGCIFQAYNLCKTIALQKTFFFLILKANNLNCFVFTMT